MTFIAETAIGSVIDGKYKIQKQIGKGGMSRVYLAVDLRLKKQWAVKEVRKYGSEKHSEIMVQSLLTEAEIMKRLDHPALPRIVDIIEDSRRIFIVMDYIEGQSMDRVVREQGAQAEADVLRWGRQICDALIYLHSQDPPIIYRDMKPANVILNPEGNVKIIDFGIAREYKAQNRTDTVVLGTRGYASPEHFGARQTDARSDIFSLGMTLHFFLTGAEPGTPGYEYASVRQWRPELSPAAEAIIDKCTAVDPDARYQTAAELMRDLESPERVRRHKFTAGLRKRAVGWSSRKCMYETGRQNRKRKLLLALAAAAVILAAGRTSDQALTDQSDRNSYETLISAASNASPDEKIEKYTEAIRLSPENPEAYVKILEAYEEKGAFGPSESAVFLALYYAHREDFDDADTDVYALNYKAGLMYFNCYTEEDGMVSFSARIQKAYPFFQVNYENGEISESFEWQELSDCYYQICSFYKKYVLSSASMEEASQEDYQELIGIIRQTMESVSKAEAYDQLSLYNGICMLLYDQRNGMASVGIEEKVLLDLLDEVYLDAEGISVQREQSKALKEEILDCYEGYRAAIERAYVNQ